MQIISGHLQGYRGWKNMDEWRGQRADGAPLLSEQMKSLIFGATSSVQ